MSTKKRKDRYFIGCDTKGCGLHVSASTRIRAEALAEGRGWWVAVKHTKVWESRKALCPTHNPNYKEKANG